MLSFDSPALGCGHLLLSVLLQTPAFWLYIPEEQETKMKTSVFRAIARKIAMSMKNIMTEEPPSTGYILFTGI